MKYAAEYNDASCWFAAKSGDGGRWLPVRAHLLDTAGIMERLVLRWLSPSAARAVFEDPAGIVPIPRTRGGDPAERKRTNGFCFYSPHTRG